jgi:nitrite reductase/ring-hydroxylating ferredoxin subunit
MPPDESNGAECAGCTLGDALARREFLRESVARALAFALPLGALQRMPMHFVRGLGARADKAYPLPVSDGVAIDKDESVIIARFGNRVWAFSLACPHQSTAIRWDAGASRFQCPKHKSRYRTDGTFIEGRATRGLDRFALRRDGGTILVNLDALYREDKEGAQWAAAFIEVEK